MLKKYAAAAIGIVDVVLLVFIAVSMLSGWRFNALHEQETGKQDAPNISSSTIINSSYNDVTGQISEDEDKTKSGLNNESQDYSQGLDMSETIIPDGSSMDTSARADISDKEAFSWKDGWKYMSADAKSITDFAAVTGGWRAYIVTDPDNSHNSYIDDYMNVKISGSETETNVTLIYGTRYIEFIEENLDISGVKSNFTGSFASGSISATGIGEVILTNFWYDNGKEYAVGTYTWPDGIVAYIGLIRQQEE